MKVAEILDELILKTPLKQKVDAQLWLGKPLYERFITELGDMKEYKGYPVINSRLHVNESAILINGFLEEGIGGTRTIF